MPYSSGRVVHDADAHIMETPTWLRDHADPAVRDRIEPLRYPGGNELRQTGDPEAQQRDLVAAFDRLRRAPRLRRVPGGRGRGDHAPQELRGHRCRSCPRTAAAALDLLGFSSQLVFNTFHNRRLHDWEHSGDLDLAYGTARAHNRGMVEFCAADPRLLPSCYVPLVDFDRAAAMADEALADGAAALLVASGCPPGHSPSHLGLDPVWARAQEAGVPIVFHVGGTGDLIDPAYFRNGLPVPARLPRRRGELPLGRLHGHPRSARPDARHHDLRRRLRALPRAAPRRDRAGRHLGAVVDAADGVGLRGLRPPRGAAPGAVAAAERLRAPTAALHALPHRRRRLDHRAGRSRACACSRRTTRTSRADGGRSSASRRHSATRPTRSASASTATTSSTSWGARPRPSPPDRTPTRSGADVVAGLRGAGLGRLGAQGLGDAADGGVVEVGVDEPCPREARGLLDAGRCGRGR